MTEILPDGRSLGGVLEFIEPAEDGLVLVSISGRKRCVPEELPLEDLIGQKVVINHLSGRWGCGAI